MTTTSEVAGPVPAPVGYPAAEGTRIPVSDPRYLEIVEFLEDEAGALDNDELSEWMALLDENIVYRAPVRVTREGGNAAAFEADMFHFNENILTLMLKIGRMTQTQSAWAENPPSRTQRIVHRIRAYETATPDEYEVRSSIMVLRSRYDEITPEIISGRRVDLLRRRDSWKIAKRTIYFDHTALGTPNLAVYL